MGPPRPPRTPRRGVPPSGQRAPCGALRPDRHGDAAGRMGTGDMGCAGCALVRGEQAVPGGLLLRDGGLVLHALAGPSPLPGWVVLTSERHARALYDLDAE